MSTRGDKPSRSGKIAVKSLIVFLHTLKWMLILALIGSFLVGGLVTGFVTSLVKNDPVRSKAIILKKLNENELTGFVYFNDKTVIGQLRTNEDRQLVKLNEVPLQLRNAFLATEDKDFYHHYGIDFNGLFRAISEKLLHEKRQTGGSTITQQLARNVFLSLDQTYSRKAKEIFLSLRLDRLLTKDDIFQAYLNKIPFGDGSSGYRLYGIKSAAKGIFGVTDLKKLNLAECAYLAGLPNAPSNLSAFTGTGAFNPSGFKAAVQRQHLVLSRMKILNKITAAQYQQAMKFDLKAALAPTQPKAYSTYPYLMLEAEREAATIMIKQQNPKLTDKQITQKMIDDTSEQLRHNGYKIYTTIDKAIYDDMQQVAKNKKDYAPDDPKKGMEQVGAMMVQNKTGAILGMIGGRDYYKEQLNHATQMLRQPGSTMKPVAAYIPALEMGAIQPGTPIDDTPIVLKDGQKGFHIPVNWDYRYHGMMTARLALNESYNIPALKLFNNVVGIPTAWDYARKMGITSLTKSDNYAKTGVIGGLEYGVSVKDLTGAYATMGNDGIHNDPFMISKIEDADGNVIYQHELTPKRVFSKETDFLITDMLRTVVSQGTGSIVAHNFKDYGKIPVVGKTGSTQDEHDAWFEGYTPDITVGVWTGYDHPAALPYGSGTHAALRTFSDIMNRAVKDEPDLFPTKKFTKPDDIVKMTVSKASGQLPSDLAKNTPHQLVTDWFNKKYIPTSVGDVLQKADVIEFNGLNYIPKPGTPSDFIKNKLVYKRTPSVMSIIDQIKELFQNNPNSIPVYHYGKATLKDYYPEDAGMDMPTKVDPRVEDGKIPDAPTNVSFDRKKDILDIKFTPSSNPDIIGYRLYRSMNGSNYQKQENVVFTGSDPKFVNYITTNFTYSYYVTAVDISGNESAASNVVTYDGAHLNALIPPPAPTTGTRAGALGNDAGLPGGTDTGILDNGGGNNSAGTDANNSPIGTDSGGTTSSDTGSANSADSANSGQSADSPPAVPAQLQAAALAGGGVSLAWKETGDTSGLQYNVYYSSSKAGKYRLIGTTDVTEFNYATNPADGWYRVSAVGSGGESAASVPVQYKSQ